MRVVPTESNHVVRLQDMLEYVGGKTTQGVTSVITSALAGTYDPSSMTFTATSVLPDTTLGDRVLLVGQLDNTQNGIYTVTSQNTLVRASDMDTSASLVNGMIVPVSDGTRWQLSVSSTPVTLDSTSLNFSQQVTDFTKVVEVIWDITGDGSTTLFTFSHNLETDNVTHEIYDSSTGETIIAGPFVRTSPNDVSLTFGVAPATTDNFVVILRARVEA